MRGVAPPDHDEAEPEPEATLVTSARAISLEYLLTAAAWQDSLLQNYRALLLSSQSLLFALGAGLFVAELAMRSAGRVYLIAGLLLGVSGSGLYATRRLQQVVLARGQDVNFWHQTIILSENELPPHQRPFTAFKVHQKQRRESARYETVFLRKRPVSEDEVRDLIGKGLGHTRRVIDRHLAYLLIGGWCLLILGAVGYAVYAAVAGV